MRIQNLLDNDSERKRHYSHMRGWFDSWRWEYCIARNIEFGNLLGFCVNLVGHNLTGIDVKFLGIAVYINFRKWDDCRGLSYGFYTDYDALVLQWGRGDFSDKGSIKFFYMPWSWGSCASNEVLCNGEFVEKIYECDKRYKQGKRDNRTVWQSSYKYTLTNGTVQNVLASYYVERSVWYWRIFKKWKIGPKKVFTGIWVDFSSEVGEGTGSWKGGTLGCGYEMLPDERPCETLRRMESERKFR